MKYLMYGKGYPMIGSHDPRMVAIGRAKLGVAIRGASARTAGNTRCSTGSVRTNRNGLVRDGKTGCASMCRTGPIGTGTSPAGSPRAQANLLFFLRSLATKG